MYLAFQPRSFFDEYIYGDSSALSSLFKIQVGSTAYGALSTTDLKDYFQITPGIGTFNLFLTTDPANGFVTSQAGNNITVSITNSVGTVLLDSVFLDPTIYQGGDAYTRFITFTSSSYDTSFYVEITNTVPGTFSYAATLAAAGADTIAPTVSSFSPADEVTGVGVESNIVLTFSEAIQRGTGSIVLKNAAGTVIETLNAASSSNLFISGNTLTIDPANVLNFGTGYKVEFAAGSIKDLAGNAYVGNTYANAPTYNFTTASNPDITPPVAPKLVTNSAFNFLVDPQITMQTSLGTIVIELNPKEAPISVANMLAYVNSGFYDGTLFHRVIPNFMVQGGGFTPGLVYKTPTYSAIPLESNNGLSNLRGTIAMARTSEMDSATSQFFINHVDNAFPSPRYAVFGKVLSGMNVVDSIAQVQTNASDVPVNNVAITSVQQTVAGSSITNSGAISVAALEVGAQWSYSLDAGATWIAGTGTSFVVPEDSYAANEIQVRQTDAAGNLSTTTGKLTSAVVVDITAPRVVSSSPVDQSAGFALDGNVAIVFSEPITKGSGTIVLRTLAGIVIESFDVASSSRLSLSGNTLTIDPTSILAERTAYKVEIALGAIRDLAGNAYAGEIGYKFTTNTLPTGAVTLGGLFKQGEMLTAANTLGDLDGLGTVAYQWKADGIAIGGATSSTLMLTQAQVGKAISVTASYTDVLGTVESVTSGASIPVENVNDAPVAGAFDNKSVAAGTAASLSLAGIFTDVDAGDVLSYAAPGLPAWLSIGAATGQISGTAPAAVGVHHITVIATDTGGLSAQTSFDLSVTGYPLSASVVTRAGAALPGVTAHELIGAAQTDMGAGGQLNATFADSNQSLSFSRGLADYQVTGAAKPVTATDALDALKLSVGLTASKGNSWKELIAADINHDGRVTAADALEILKVSVGVNTLQPSWVFVPDDAGINPNLGSMDKAHVSYSHDLSLASIAAPASATITGILVGDVNNSWLIPVT